MDLERKLDAANARLKAANIGVTILLRGSKLSIRATLPPKPGSSKTQPHPQVISLGIYANNEGIRQCEAEAKKLGALLACREFDWSLYIKEETTVAASTPSANKTIEQWVEEFEADYFSRRARNSKSETTYKGDYLKSFRLLDPTQPLTSELIKQVILSTQPDTKTRKRVCMALNSLASYAGLNLDFDLKSLAGKYSPRSVNERDLPTDDQIKQWFNSFRNPYWQWAYGMIATYGLRPSELWYADLDEYRRSQEPWSLQIKDGKTGPRRIYPLWEYWVEEFSLLDVRLPKVTGRNSADLSHRFGEYLSDNSIPHKGYDLRHAYSRRAYLAGWSAEFTSRMMGHSLAIHTSCYGWYREDADRKLYQEYLDNKK